MKSRSTDVAGENVVVPYPCWTAVSTGGGTSIGGVRHQESSSLRGVQKALGSLSLGEVTAEELQVRPVERKRGGCVINSCESICFLIDLNPSMARHVYPHKSSHDRRVRRVRPSMGKPAGSDAG